MERYKEGANRNQMSLLPLSFDEMIDAENPVRAIDAIVENMDIPPLGFQHAQTAATGRKPYSPVAMFKLYTYSYFNGIYVELPSMKLDNGLNTYGAYYVPAVEGKYIENMPVWDGSFN